MTSANLNQLHEKNIELYNQAEQLALGYFKTIKTQENYEIKEDKKFTSLVTKADKEINDLLIDGLIKSLPGSSVIGEEKSQITQDAKYTWIVDPIDGTNNYQKGLDMWGISISLWENGNPIYGCIIFPRLLDRMLYGWRNGGVHILSQSGEIETLELKPKNEFKPGFTISTIKSEMKDHAMHIDIGQNTSYHATGCTTYNGLNTIKGSYDFLLAYKSSPWDMGAIIAMTNELGFKIDYLDRKIELGDSEFIDYNYSLLITKPEYIEFLPKTYLNMIVEFEAQL